MTSIGERIYDLRNRNNMSQGNLADKLDVSRQTISKWENNMCLPEAEKLLQLSEIFGVSIDYILKGEAEPQPSQEPIYIYVKDPEGENTSKYNERLIRKYVGIVLGVVGGLLTIGFALDSSLFCFVTAPLTILGILMAINLKHPWLIASWITYIVIMSCSAYFTALNPLSFFFSIFYALRGTFNIFQDYNTTVSFLLSLLMWIPLPILILCTVKAKRGYIFRPKDNS